MMELLDAPTPAPTATRRPRPCASPGQGQGILVSGHDLQGPQAAARADRGQGHQRLHPRRDAARPRLPGLKKYPHLVGNYGGAWQDQQRSSSDLPGAILMTTNCIQKPRDTYKDRIFTTGVVGLAGRGAHRRGRRAKDFSPVIEARRWRCRGFTEDEPEPKTILTGFGHARVLGVAGAVIDAVKAGRSALLPGGRLRRRQARPQLLHRVRRAGPPTP
jgi:hydroxylamine reductase